MTSAIERLVIVEDLLDIVLFQFVRRLIKKNPTISETEIEKEVSTWFQKGQSECGTPVDIKKYFHDSI